MRLFSSQVVVSSQEAVFIVFLPPLPYRIIFPLSEILKSDVFISKNTAQVKCILNDSLDKIDIYTTIVLERF